MGADENAETKSKAVEPSSESEGTVKEQLDNGWTVQELEYGQLLLVPPPETYRDDR